MGINWDEIWGNAKQAIDQGLDQVKQVGVPAIQASAEKWLLNTVQAQHEATTAKLSDALKEAQAAPSGPISDAFKDVAKDQVFSMYGHWMIFGVAAIAVGGYLVLRK